MELLESKQPTHFTEITHGKARFPTLELSDSKAGFLNLDLHVLKELWEEFRDCMNLDGKKIACLCSVTSD